MNEARRFVCGLALGILSVCFLPVSAFPEEIPIRVDGRVVRAHPEESELLVDYLIPATGEYVRQMFRISENTGFKDFKKLGDLKEGDLVSLDYYDRKPIPETTYIILMPREKVYFTRQEIAGALLQIKSNSKK